MKLTMIVRVLFTVQVVNATFGWIDCKDFDANRHCYLTGVDSTQGVGTKPAILSEGYYDAEDVGYHVCDENNKVYKQVYLAQNHVLQDTDTAKDISHSDFNTDTNCFKVANVPTLLTNADCWTDHGEVGDENTGGVMNAVATSLVACKEACMLLTSCVAIHYNPDDEVCYTRAGLGDTTSATGNEGGKLYKRRRCARLPAALDTSTANSDYK
jgi:hypothetical protein